MPYSIVIAGVGATGTAWLHRFAQSIAEAGDGADISQIEVTIVEKDELCGTGTPYHPKNVWHSHLLNVPAKFMSIDPKDGDHFVKWLQKEYPTLEKEAAYLKGEFPELSGAPADGFYPRFVYGMYLADTFELAFDKLRSSGVKVTLLTGREVTNIRDLGQSAEVEVKNLASGEKRVVRAEGVLQSTGHWDRKPTKPYEKASGFFASPWPANKIREAIPENRGENVAALGALLSTVDLALTLYEGQFVKYKNGRQTWGADYDGIECIPRQNAGGLILLPGAKPDWNPTKITAYSRSGLFPKVRGRVGSYKNQFLTKEALDAIRRQNDGMVPLDDAYRLLAKELDAAYTRIPGDIVVIDRVALHALHQVKKRLPKEDVEGAIDRVLSKELGEGMDWREVQSPTLPAKEVLRMDLWHALHGDSIRHEGSLTWYTVLVQSFGIIRQFYLDLPPEDRERYDRDMISTFHTYVAPIPPYNAAKMLALMEAGILKIVKVGHDYNLEPTDGGFEIRYTDESGQSQTAFHKHLVDCRGQTARYDLSPEELAANLLSSGTVHPYKRPHAKVNPNGGEKGFYDAGGIEVDPKTMRVMRGNGDSSEVLYYVGAALLPQIIDTSTAGGMAELASRVADQMAEKAKLLTKSAGVTIVGASASEPKGPYRAAQQPAP